MAWEPGPYEEILIHLIISRPDQNLRYGTTMQNRWDQTDVLFPLLSLQLSDISIFPMEQLFKKVYICHLVILIPIPN